MAKENNNKSFVLRIDAATMDIHYNRHHAAYVAALNNAAKDNGVIANASVGELIRRAAGEDTRDEQAFRRLCDTVRVDNADQMRSIVSVVARTLTLRQQVLRLLPRAAAASPAPAKIPVHFTAAPQPKVLNFTSRII